MHGDISSECVGGSWIRGYAVGGDGCTDVIIVDVVGRI